MAPPRPFSPRYDAALAFAARAHAGQLRKGTNIPYIVHPVHVAHTLAAHGFDEDTVIAGLLHDTLEDTPATADAIRASFGDAVLELVLAVTQPSGGDRKGTWRERKQAAIDHLVAGGPAVAALKAADALHNAGATLAELDTHGPTVWSRFNGTPDDIVWYYTAITTACRTCLGDHALVAALDAVVLELAKRVP